MSQTTSSGSADTVSVERILRRTKAASSATSPANPKVEPGKVNWHDDYDTALMASRVTGKPVLLFQLLGQLDQRFT